MEKTGSIDKLNRHLVKEWGLALEVSETPAAKRLQGTRKTLQKHVADVGKSGDLDLILATERAFLVNDQNRYSNSPAMANSLSAALAELASAEGHV